MCVCGCVCVCVYHSLVGQWLFFSKVLCIVQIMDQYPARVTSLLYNSRVGGSSQVELLTL